MPKEITHFSVKNFEKFQHYKQRNPPWIKLYNSLLDDPDFIALDVPSRYHYLSLLLLASKQNNIISTSPDYLKKMLRLDDAPDLMPLFERGFLLATRKHSASKTLAPCKQLAMSETETEESKNPLYVSPLSPTPQSTRFPEGWTPKSEHQTWCQKKGIKNITELAEAFGQDAQAKGKTFKDWNMAFYTWLRNAIKFGDAHVSPIKHTQPEPPQEDQAPRSQAAQDLVAKTIGKIKTF